MKKKSYILYLKRIIKPFFQFFSLWVTNYLISYVPIWKLRFLWFTLMGCRFGKKSRIDMKSYFLDIRKLRIGSFTHINRDCMLDCRGGISIGNNVSISFGVSIFTGSHDIQSKDFSSKFQKVNIKDYVYLGPNSIILQGITIGEGSVVCAGAVVTKDVLPYTVVAGIPASKIGNRERMLSYNCKQLDYFC